MIEQQLLFTPIKVGNLVVKNRIVFSAHLTNYAENNMPTSRHEHYYLERARGGVGLIITEEQSVHPSDHPYEKLIHAFNPEVINRYKHITNAVHAQGTAILAQINHNGGQSSGMYTRRPVLAPSSIPDPMFREVPKAMEQEDIQDVIQGYALVASHTQQGGFDGIELQCSHSSLVRQFLSRQANLRDDQYGGSLSNRMRFLREIIIAIRSVVGPGYVIGVRLCGDELCRDGITLEEAVDMASCLEADGGIDYINTSIGTATHTLFMIEGSMHVPPGYALYISSALRKAIRLPVIGVGRIKDPVQAERVLQDGHADMVGIVRGQISDPEFALKARQNRADQIRLCLSCNQECVGRMGLNRWLGCIQTVSTGKEKTMGIGKLQKIQDPKKVFVVGGGPAGLRAAVTAAQRGHNVTIIEQQPIFGGQINLATRITNRSELGELIRNLLQELAGLHIEKRIGVCATKDDILAECPDVVIVATGSYPNPVSFPGAHHPLVVDHTEILSGVAKLGHRIIIVDQLSDHRTMSIAEYVAEKGCKTEIVTNTFYAGQELGVTLDLETWHRRASKRGINITPNVSILGLEDGKLNGIHNYSGQPIQWQKFDMVILSVPARANDSLYFELKGCVPELYRIGDCLAPRRAHAAILDGERIGRLV